MRAFFEKKITQFQIIKSFSKVDKKILKILRKFQLNSKYFPKVDA